MNFTLNSRYNGVVEDYLNGGMAKEVTRDSTSLSGTETYYPPHHDVLREDKVITTLQVMFDTSSHKDRSSSHNDCILTGPHLNPDMMSILSRIRLYEVAYVAFLQT